MNILLLIVVIAAIALIFIFIVFFFILPTNSNSTNSTSNTTNTTTIIESPDLYILPKDIPLGLNTMISRTRIVPIEQNQNFGISTKILINKINAIHIFNIYVEQNLGTETLNQ